MQDRLRLSAALSRVCISFPAHEGLSLWFVYKHKTVASCALTSDNDVRPCQGKFVKNCVRCSGNCGNVRETGNKTPRTTRRSEFRHVMRSIPPLRHGLFLIRSIMQLNVTASAPQPSLQLADKRFRSTTPEVVPQAGTGSTAPKRRKKRKHTPPEPGSAEDVISREVVGLLGSEIVTQAEADGLDWESPFGFREQVELTVSSISSSGESCAKIYAYTYWFFWSCLLFTSALPIFVLVWFLTKNRRRTCTCPVVEASMGRRRSVRFARRGNSRPRIPARKDVLLCRSNQH